MRDHDDSGDRATVSCADCGCSQRVPALARRGVAHCRRCDRILDRRLATESSISLACAVAILALLPPAAFLPFLRTTIENLVFGQSRLIATVPVVARETWSPLAVGILLFAFAFPAVRAMIWVAVIGSIRWGWRLPARGRLFRWSEELRVWSMTEVVVIAGLVTYVRADIPGDATILVGSWCYLAVAVLAFVGDHALDRRAVWAAILPDRELPPEAVSTSCSVCELAVVDVRPGADCPRCGETLGRELPRRFPAALLTFAIAAPLVLPSYAFTLMVNRQLNAVVELSVLGTVQMLADRGVWLVGALVLFVGVVLPVLILLVLAWLLASVRFPSRRGLVLRTRVYRVVSRLVDWPMVIPLIVAVSSPIVAFHGIDEILVGRGAAPYFLMIVLMVATVRLFEPRMMWRTAEAT